MLAYEGRSRRSIAMDRRTGGRRLQRGKVECLTVVQLPSLARRVLMADLLLLCCGVGGASLANRLDAGKRHAVWWVNLRSCIYEKTRSSSMAETGFGVVIGQALDAPMVCVLGLLCPRRPGCTTVCCVERGCLLSRSTSIVVTSLPYQSRYDSVQCHSKFTGKGAWMCRSFPE